MRSVEERLSETEREVAVMRDILERNLVNDGDFQKEIKLTLDYLKERNIKVDNFIESEMQVRKDRAEFWKSQKDKLATAGILGALSGIGTVIWYAIVHWVQNPR